VSGTDRAGITPTAAPARWRETGDAIARWYWASIPTRPGGPPSTGERTAQEACGGGGGHPAGRVAARAPLGTPRCGDFAIARPSVPADSRIFASPAGAGAGSRGGIEIALGAGDDATTGLRSDGPIRSTNDTKAPMTAAASVTAPAPNASRRPLPLRRAAAGAPTAAKSPELAPRSGNGGPRSRSSWRRISSIARLSWSVSGGSSGCFIAMASCVRSRAPSLQYECRRNTRRSMARPARECNGTLVQ